MLKYQFNEHGVCIDPTVPYSLKNNYAIILITIAEQGGKWGFGYKVHIDIGGFSCVSGPICKDRMEYSSEREVLLAATDYVAEHIKSEKKQKDPKHQQLFSCFADFWSYYESLRQLSIF